jgi:undecaprenyl-diphosphatase
MIDILRAIVLGIVEGLTEFLPISSTGHLIVAEKLLAYKDIAELFTVVVQFGAILAVFWHYRKDILSLVSKLFAGDLKTRQFWGKWIIATVPVALAGFALDSSLSRIATVTVVGSALVLGGLVMLGIETYHTAKDSGTEPSIDTLTVKQAFIVGCYQLLALVPGVSRSGATIMGGLLAGLDRLTATAFSFYLSMPILLLATGYKLTKEGDQLSSLPGGAPALLLGTVSSFFTALIVIRWLLRYVSTHDFKMFAYYRISVGMVLLLLVFFGTL